MKAIKQWGKHRLKLNNRDSKTDSDLDRANTSSNRSLSSQDRNVKQKKKTAADKILKQNPLYLSSSSTFGNYFLPETNGTGNELNSVKMREAVTSRRSRRSNVRGQRIEEINSSSGNWSASSESGRTSASSENTVQTKALMSDGSTQFKRKLLDSSTPSRNGSSELSRNGDFSHRDLYDDENSSIYSCDTEGYFTSFHLDSGLKSMKHASGLDCDYGLFGKSGNGSSKVHGNGDELSHTALDSVDENESHHTLVHVDLEYELSNFKRQLRHESHANDSDLELQFSNSSELQLIDQESRLRAEKTLIDSSRIPMMSEITPSNSDEDEQIVLESLLQTLNCKPLERLACGTEQRPGRPNGGQATTTRNIIHKSPVPIALNTDNAVISRTNIATIAKQPIRLKANNSQSLHDISNLSNECTANHKVSKYWTMPLLKKKRFLKIMKSFDQPDGPRTMTVGAGPVATINAHTPLDKVPSKKFDKLNGKTCTENNINNKSNNYESEPTKSINTPSMHAKPITPQKTQISLADQTNFIHQSHRSDHMKVNSQTVNTTCADNKPTAKTTLLDFKKLLLSTAGKKSYERQSATELLKVAKEPPFPIQDLSYSPRALSNRRPMRGQKHASPVKKSNVMSPRSKWKYKHFDTNYITSIPEATNEEENASISSQDANQNTIGIDERKHAKTTYDLLDKDEPASISGDDAAIAVAITPAPVGVIEKENDLNNVGISMKTNMFLQEEENNFMRGEVKKYTPIRKLANFEKRIDPFSEFRKESNSNIDNNAIASNAYAASTTSNDENEKKAEQRPTLETSF